ncbi:auxin-responsive protein IAA27-like isoform X2 [Salvia miltiorrhiza]|uniref:auxin-responsive protein IAA27-like isoform X2 n=1 Tax=Salvia miltiorrhiza TaxID=226208 RepID=UPI0025AD90E6|nr:auxin-responsive protein IAA27-like isoform X2 [Salvia miltiorrhiza]
MSIPQEHDYIGLSEPLPSEKSSDKMAAAPSPSSNDERNSVFNLKETELRLGLPGSEAPERKGGIGIGVSLFGKDLKDESKCVKSFVSGAKRGFSDAINGAGKWGLSINGESGADLMKNGGLNCSNESSVKQEIPSVKPVAESKSEAANTAPASKAQVVGWPPIPSFRKSTLATNIPKKDDVGGKSGSGCLYVKVSMDGAPYLRKIDLKTYCSYAEISSALEKMFSCFTIGQCGQGLAAKEHLSESHLMDLLHGSEYVLTYEDKDGDWMLVGDVPWEMFTDSCRRLRIMKGSDAIGLAPRTMQKCKTQN